MLEGIQVDYIDDIISIMHMICIILMMADKPMWGLPTCSKLYFILVGQLLDDQHNFFFMFGVHYYLTISNSIDHFTDQIHL